MSVHIDIMSFEPPLAVVIVGFRFFQHLVPTTNDAYVWSSHVNHIIFPPHLIDEGCG